MSRPPTPRLPAEFSDLEPFVDSWAKPTEAQRNRVRLNSEMADIEAFYQAILPRMDAILAHLNRYPVNDIPPEGQGLFCLACAFMEVSPAVELFSDPDVPNSFPGERLLIRENEYFAGKP